jgi:hypothetical protein
MGSAANSLRDALVALKREKAKTEKAISALEELLRDMDSDSPDPRQYSLTSPSTAAREAVKSLSVPTWYGGKTIGDAAVEFLRQSGNWTRVPHIWRVISNAGIKSGSKNPSRMLYNILMNRLDKDVAKRGAEWGLKEWEESERTLKAVSAAAERAAANE